MEEIPLLFHAGEDILRKVSAGMQPGLKVVFDGMESLHESAMLAHGLGEFGKCRFGVRIDPLELRKLGLQSREEPLHVNRDSLGSGGF